MERTLIILKPDAVQRGLVGEIITRFEKKGLQMVGGKFMKIPTQLANRFGLLKTGGSDFHGSNKKDIELGSARGRRIPREFFDRLIDKHQELSPATTRP